MAAMPRPGDYVYNTIGVGYAVHRQTDPRLRDALHGALGDAQRVVNVGAGTGSYEPDDRTVVSLEPSSVMLAQHRGARVVQGVAEALPLCDHSFDAALAILTTHHWSDLAAGLAELRRVARRQVVFTWDPRLSVTLWIAADYLPELNTFDLARSTSLDTVADLMGASEIVPFPAPWDCLDGFQAAFWRRPEAYLDPAVRAASSTFASLPDEIVAPPMARLRHDLESGRWHERYRSLLERDSMDYGYRILIAEQ